MYFISHPVSGQAGELHRVSRDSVGAAPGPIQLSGGSEHGSGAGHLPGRHLRHHQHPERHGEPGRHRLSWTRVRHQVRGATSIIPTLWPLQPPKVSRCPLSINVAPLVEVQCYTDICVFPKKGRRDTATRGLAISRPNDRSVQPTSFFAHRMAHEEWHFCCFRPAPLIDG